jgi:hypothetical protein
MGEPSPSRPSYNVRSGREVGTRGRGQRLSGARDGLDLGRFELGEALAPPHLIPLGAEHLRHRPIAWRFHP